MLPCDKCPFVALGEDLLDETRVHRVTGALGDNMADEREAKKRNIADQVQHFVSNKFVGEAKAGLIDNTFFGQDHRVIQGSAFPKSS